MEREREIWQTHLKIFGTSCALRIHPLAPSMGSSLHSRFLTSSVSPIYDNYIQIENINKHYLYAKNECLKQAMGSTQSLRFKSMCSV